MHNETKDENNLDLSRRNLLKLTLAGLLAGVAAPILHLSPARAAVTGTDGKKALIIYFSRSGNTREVAHQIHERVGGEIIELQTVEPYPEDYEAVKEQAMKELNSGLKPELKTKVEKIGYYDIIFVGTPIWWGTIAGPVKTFLSEYELTGKTVVPFITHAGSSLGRSVTDMAALCPNSTFLDGLAVWGKSAKTAQNEVAGWLRKINVTK
jgi:flavodoxin